MQEIFPATSARLAEWQAQPEVTGVLLVGSKGHEHADELSDDDLEVYVSATAFAQLAPAACSELLIEGEGANRTLIYDAQITTLADLQRKIPSHHDLDHWPYERGRVLFDRDGTLGPLVQAAGSMDSEFRRLRLLHGTIDTWIAAARARKTLRRGARASTHQLIARGGKALTRILFALEWRWTPLDHWLEAELRTLSDPTHAGEKLITALLTDQPEPLDEALNELEDRLFAEGVPRLSGRHDLFLELIHISHAQERAIHGTF